MILALYSFVQNLVKIFSQRQIPPSKDNSMLFKQYYFLFLYLLNYLPCVKQVTSLTLPKALELIHLTFFLRMESPNHDRSFLQINLRCPKNFDLRLRFRLL